MNNQPAKYKRVEFSDNTNNKLLCTVFVTITPVHKGFLLSETCDIRISEQHFCYAKVINTYIASLDSILETGIYLLDSGLSDKTLYLNHIQSLYSKKSWWKGENTAFKVVFFEKVQQLSIFEDGIYPIDNLT